MKLSAALSETTGNVLFRINSTGVALPSSQPLYRISWIALGRSTSVLRFGFARSLHQPNLPGERAPALGTGRSNQQLVGREAPLGVVSRRRHLVIDAEMALPQLEPLAVQQTDEMTVSIDADAMTAGDAASC